MDVWDEDDNYDDGASFRYFSGYLRQSSLSPVMSFEFSEDSVVAAVVVVVAVAVVVASSLATTTTCS